MIWCNIPSAAQMNSEVCRIVFHVGKKRTVISGKFTLSSHRNENSRLSGPKNTQPSHLTKNAQASDSSYSERLC